MTNATSKQRDFIRRLIDERMAAADEQARDQVDTIRAAANKADAEGGFDTRLASAAIDALLAIRVARAAAKTVAADVTPGVYVTDDGSIVKVKPNKAGTRVYGEVWTDFGGTRLTLEGETVNAHWVYERGLIHEVRAAQRMTLDQARAFITIYRRCARCGRKLKAAESVERGIGPVCRTYFTFGEKVAA